MWMVWLITFFLFASPAYAAFGFGEQYERDDTIFDPLNQARPDNPINPVNAVDPGYPLDPLNRYNPALRADRPKQTAGAPGMD
jgi:hypothetical protein